LPLLIAQTNADFVLHQKRKQITFWLVCLNVLDKLNNPSTINNLKSNTMTYAGHKKVFKDNERKLKKEKSREKSNSKKANLKKAYYYAKLLNKNNK